MEVKIPHKNEQFFFWGGDMGQCIMKCVEDVAERTHLHSAVGAAQQVHTADKVHLPPEVVTIWPVPKLLWTVLILLLSVRHCLLWNGAVVIITSVHVYYSENAEKFWLLMFVAVSIFGMYLGVGFCLILWLSIIVYRF